MNATDLRELVERAQTHFDSLSPSAKLRHRYMQRRSFTRGMCPDHADFKEWCERADKLLPHEKCLTDTQIGLILAGEAWV